MTVDIKEFSRFLIDQDVLKFGTFTLKSGRQSPHFINSGRFDNGQSLNRLGEYFAQAIEAEGGCDTIFGPAYKGIPLAVATACARDRLYGKRTGILFDRKEVKDHAEGGLFVSHLPEKNEKVILIDDVISSGISLKQAATQLKKHFDMTAAFALVAVDRQERGQNSDVSAAQELEAETGVPLKCLVSLSDVVDVLHNEIFDGQVVVGDAEKNNVLEYLKAYGHV